MTVAGIQGFPCGTPDNTCLADETFPLNTVGQKASNPAVNVVPNQWRLVDLECSGAKLM